MTTDTTEVSTRRRPRIWRLFAMTCVLVVALGAGWIAGLKTHETTDLAELSSAAWAKLADLIETSRTRLSAMPQRQTTDQQTPPELSTTTERAGFVARELEGISLKLDQYRASSEAAVEGLRETLNRIVSSLESNQRPLEVNLDALRARLDRGSKRSCCNRAGDN